MVSGNLVHLDSAVFYTFLIPDLSKLRDERVLLPLIYTTQLGSPPRHPIAAEWVPVLQAKHAEMDEGSIEAAKKAGRSHA